MWRVKGCLQSDCSEHIKKVKYRTRDQYCKKCGHKLGYVCKKCFTPIANGSSKRFCIRCEAGRQDRRIKIKRGVIKYGTIFASAAGGLFLWVKGRNDKNT